MKRTSTHGTPLGVAVSSEVPASSSLVLSEAGSQNAGSSWCAGEHADADGSENAMNAMARARPDGLRRWAQCTPLRYSAFALLAMGCGDPVDDELRASLGPEGANVAVGPLHRPGQPCLACHDGSHARSFTVAGTIYSAAEGSEPLAGVRVQLIDGHGRPYQAETNCAGNFFVRPEDFDPAFPLHVEIRYGTWDLTMDSPIRRAGSCATCHGATTSPSSAGPIFVAPTAAALPPRSCP